MQSIALVCSIFKCVTGCFMKVINNSKGIEKINKKSKTLKLSAMVGLSTFLTLMALTATSPVLLLPTIPPVQAQQAEITSGDINGSRSVNATTLGNITVYTAAGSIRSTIVPQQDPDKPYITFGYWNSSVDNGNLVNFYSNFTMARVNGSETHNHQITNFTADNGIVLTGGPLGSSTIFSGQADVQTNGNPKWNNVSASIIIDRFDTISIALDSRTTDNHFNGQPVTGIVESVKSPEGTELIVVDVDIPPAVILPANQTNDTAM